MENHLSWLAQFVNQVFGRFALAILSALHIKPNNPSAPIPEHVVMAFCVLLLGAGLALLLRSRLSVERPGGMQQVAELLLTNPMGFGSRTSPTCCMRPEGQTSELPAHFTVICLLVLDKKIKPPHAHIPLPLR